VPGLHNPDFELFRERIILDENWIVKIWHLFFLFFDTWCQVYTIHILR